MKHCSISYFAVAIACFGFVLTAFSYHSKETVQDNVDLRTYTTEDGSWSVCYDQNNRTRNYYQADTSDKHIFFSYSKYSCVDVYDHEGTFQYSIILPNKQNGVVGVRCDGSKTYIIAKDDSVYIFEELTLLQYLSREEAIALGYTWSWFDEKENRLTVDQSHIRWLDENGNVIKTVATPSTVRETIPLSIPQPLMLVIILSIVLAVVAIIATSVWSIFRDIAHGINH